MKNTTKLDTACVQLLNCAKGHATTTSALTSFASNRNTIIILLQEPAIEHTKLPPTHPDFHVFTPVNERPLCATYVRRLPGLQTDITFTHANSFLGTRISLPTSPPFTIYNFYSPGTPHAIANLLPSFHPHLPAIIMGDFNAHHEWWGSTTTINDDQIRRQRDQSQTIANWMEDHHFFLHNKPGHPTHFPRNGMRPSVIDLCFSAGCITGKILMHEINPDSTSDHAICTIHLNLTIPSKAPKRAWHRADWTLFWQTILDTALDLSNITSADQALQATETINTIINNATNAAIPWVTPRPKQAPWWHPDLSKKNKQLQRAERRYRTNHNDNNLR
jgi:hypothetical protein